MREEREASQFPLYSSVVLLVLWRQQLTSYVNGELRPKGFFSLIVGIEMRISSPRKRKRNKYLQSSLWIISETIFQFPSRNCALLRYISIMMSSWDWLKDWWQICLAGWKAYFSLPDCFVGKLLAFQLFSFVSGLNEWLQHFALPHYILA